jgi:hypothetical protein
MLFTQINSHARGTSNSKPLRLCGMRKPLKDWQVQEAKRLKAIWDRRKPKISQEAFAFQYGFGTQGAVWQYLHARTPLNLVAAIKFAKGLGCLVKDFSPRLADELADIQAVLAPTGEEQYWLKAIEALTPEQKTAVRSIIDQLAIQHPDRRDEHARRHKDQPRESETERRSGSDRRRYFNYPGLPNFGEKPDKIELRIHEPRPKQKKPGAGDQET